jgi:hypothetical protein
MIPTEQQKQRADGRWKQQKTVLSKSVVLDHSAAIMNPDLIQCLLVIPVQRRKVCI